jgi:RHH-type transcriptional regulator, rel operon repressor / antitoxin RelB
MPVIEIPPELETQYEYFAQQNGKSKDDLVRQALVSYLEDLEDIAVATERLKNPGKRIPFEEVMKNLGLDD